MFPAAIEFTVNPVGLGACLLALKLTVNPVRFGACCSLAIELTVNQV